MNNSLFSRLRVQILSAVLCVALVFYPVRKSEAIVPVVYSAMTAAGITITAADLAGLSIAIAGMGALIWMNITAPDGSSMAIPTYAGGQVPQPVVAPLPVIPSHIEWNTKGSGGVFAWTAPWCSAAERYVSWLTFNNEPRFIFTVDQCTDGVSEGTVFWRQFDTTYGGTVYGTSTISETRWTADSCPSGSTMVSGACVVDDPYAAADDGRQDVVRTGNGYSIVPADQTGSTTASIGTTSTAGDTVTFNISPGYSAPVATTIVANPDGGSTISSHTQKTDVSGATYVSTTNIIIDGSGIPISTSTINVSGGLDASGVVPVITSLSSGVVPTVITPSPAIPVTSSPIVFPTDYARSGEAVSANAPLVTALTGTDSVADPTEPLSADMPGWGNTFDNLTGWSLPAHSSACPQPSMDLSNILGAGSVYTMSAHCDLFAQHAATFQAVMVVVWSILALFLVLGA